MLWAFPVKLFGDAGDEAREPSGETSITAGSATATANIAVAERIPGSRDPHVRRLSWLSSSWGCCGLPAVEAFLGQEPGNLVGYLDVVQIGEWEVGVAPDAALGKVHHGHVPPCRFTASRHSRAISSRARQLSCAGMFVGSLGMLSP